MVMMIMMMLMNVSLFVSPAPLSEEVKVSKSTSFSSTPLTTPFLPILLMHGVTADNGSMSDLEQFIRQAVPAGTFITSINSENTVQSLLKPMWEQVTDFSQKVDELKKRIGFSEFHLICHSQGGLLCRSYIQLTKNHGVRVFISLSGVQNGEFGIPQPTNSVLQLLHQEFPWLWNMTMKEVYRVFYTDFFQKMLSVANYWKDPYHYMEYRLYNQFLSIVNNDSLTTDYAKIYNFKENFLQIDKIILTGSPQDEVIHPYFSAFFEFYKLNSNTMQLLISPMQEQDIYVRDVFGLKTLDIQKRLIIENVPNVLHMDWIERRDLFEKYMLPYLY
nr:unnamed protein product [Naegleria fowleri]